MPNTQPLTDEFLNDFLEDAVALENGAGSDPTKVAKVIGRMAHIQVHTLRHGCYLYANHKRGMAITTLWAVIAGMATFAGTALAIASMIINHK